MITPFVCRRCFHKLIQFSGQFRNASFVSLARLADREGEHQSQVQRETLGNPEPTSNGQNHRRRRKSFAQQYREQRQPTGVDQVLETLFSSARTQENVAQVSRYSRTPKEEHVIQTASDRSIEYRLLELHNQLQRRTARLEYIWASCRQLLGERNWKREEEISEDDKRKASDFAFRDILLAISSEQPILEHDIAVTPATVITLYRDRGVMKYWWHQVIWNQIGQAIQLRHGEEDVEATMVSEDKKPLILQNLLDIWVIFLERYQLYSGAVYVQGLQKHSAVSNPHSTRRESTQKGVNMLLRLLPKHPNNIHTGSMISAALMTSDLMDVEGISCPHLLSGFLQKLRRHADLDVEAAKSGLNEAGVSNGIMEKALKKWVRLPIDHGNRQPRHRDSLGERKPLTVLDWGQKSLIARRKEIDGVIKRKDTENAINLWDNYVAYLKMQQHEDKETGDSIFARFLCTFWAIHRSDRAIDVWNYMVETGHTPGQIHWHAMLDGCVRAHDVTSLREIWAKMSRSDPRPDIHTWTKYIRGLIRFGKWQEGFQALELLGRTWRRVPATENSPISSNHQIDNPLSPTIIPVNSALSALIAANKPELTPIVISWAESQNLPLETYTFNILLKPLVRNGNQAQIQSHLAQMAEHNCPPDVATFTIILNGLVSNKHSDFRSLPNKAQESTITSILKDMEDKGLPPNAHTYTTLLGGLLDGKSVLRHFEDSSTNNILAARTILAHMHDRKIFPSPHIYTILISHYFACTPPDLPAINSLWASIRHSGQTSNLDHFFYDRIIEGYADIDEVEKALQFLRRVPLEGKIPGWQALHRVLAALDRAGEWDMCRELVKDVDDRENGFFKHGQGRRRGKALFIELVDDLRAKGVTIGGEEQL